MHDNRIVPWAPYGAHIAIRCTQCGRVGHTKNIEHIGARTLFDVCSCSAPLEPAQPVDAAQRIRDLELAATLSDFIDQYINERTPDLRQLNKRRAALGKTLEWVRDQRQLSYRYYHSRVRRLLNL